VVIDLGGKGELEEKKKNEKTSPSGGKKLAVTS